MDVALLVRLPNGDHEVMGSTLTFNETTSEFNLVYMLTLWQWLLAKIWLPVQEMKLKSSKAPEDHIMTTWKKYIRGNHPLIWSGFNNHFYGIPILQMLTT